MEEESILSLSEEGLATTSARGLLVSIFADLLQNRSLVERPLEELCMALELLQRLAGCHRALACTQSLFLTRLATEVKELACLPDFQCLLRRSGYSQED